MCKKFSYRDYQYTQASSKEFSGENGFIYAFEANQRGVEYGNNFFRWSVTWIAAASTCFCFSLFIVVHTLSSNSSEVLALSSDSLTPTTSPSLSSEVFSLSPDSFTPTTSPSLSYEIKSTIIQSPFSSLSHITITHAPTMPPTFITTSAAEDVLSNVINSQLQNTTLNGDILSEDWNLPKLAKPLLFIHIRKTGGTAICYSLHDNPNATLHTGYDKGDLGSGCNTDDYWTWYYYFIDNEDQPCPNQRKTMTQLKHPMKHKWKRKCRGPYISSTCDDVYENYVNHDGKEDHQIVFIEYPLKDFLSCHNFHVVATIRDPISRAYSDLIQNGIWTLKDALESYARWDARNDKWVHGFLVDNVYIRTILGAELYLDGSIRIEKEHFEQAKQAVEKFLFVIPMELIQKWWNVLGDNYGWNIESELHGRHNSDNKPSYVDNPTLLNTIQRKNYWDLKLYKWMMETQIIEKKFKNR